MLNKHIFSTQQARVLIQYYLLKEATSRGLYKFLQNSDGYRTPLPLLTVNWPNGMNISDPKQFHYGAGVGVPVTFTGSPVVVADGESTLLQMLRTTTISAAMFGSLSNSEASITEAISNASEQ